MNCPKCQTPIPNNARFCGTCGQAVESTPPEAAAIPLGATAAGTSTAGATTWSTPPPALPSMPGLLQRIKNILLSPGTEWPVIAAEPTSQSQIFIGYVAPLSALAAVMAFIHMSVIGISLPFGGAIRTPVLSGLFTAVLTVVMAFIGVFIIALIINALAPTFGGQRDLRQAVKGAAYSLTPAYVSSVLALSPILGTLLQLLALLYGIYVLYVGLPIVMRSPRERAVGYTATTVLCTFLVGILFGVASASLGIYGHSTSGLLGRNVTSDDQSTAAVGAMIGGALGTDAKGKAGLTAALNNLVKAGEQNEAAAAAAARAAPPVAAPAETTATGGSSDAAQNPAAAVGGLMTALGGALGGDHPVAVLDFHALTPLLPAALPGMKRTEARGESGGAMGVKTASATGTYQGDNGAGMHVEITDMAAVSGLMNMAGALAQETSSESDSGFERDQNVGGRTVHEIYDNRAKHGELSLILVKRYKVDITGDNVDIGALEQALGSIDLGRLESMKDVGGTPK
jgi:hypothetical protein